MKKFFAPLGAVLAALLTLSLTANAQEPSPGSDLVMINGQHWTQSQRSSKLAFLMGLGNFFEVEQALQEGKPVADNESLIPVFARGLDNETLPTIMQKVDAWYTQNPNQLDRPVIEVIYFEIALPQS